MNSTITLSERTFHLLSRRAEQVKRPPTELAEEILLEQLSPSHPYIDMVQTISGSRAVIKGTRIPISVIVGYLQAGETPETLANEVLHTFHWLPSTMRLVTTTIIRTRSTKSAPRTARRQAGNICATGWGKKVTSASPGKINDGETH